MAALTWAVYQEPIQGENCCGDAYLVHQDIDTGIVALIDGLGHGIEAAYAANRAVELLAQNKNLNGISSIKLLHKQLRSTRGIVLGLIIINFSANQLNYWGIGNIQVQIRSKTTCSLVSASGVVGFRLPKHLINQQYPFYPGDYLLMLTDGIKTDWEWPDALISNRGTPSQIVAFLGDNYAKSEDDTTILVIKRQD